MNTNPVNPHLIPVEDTKGNVYFIEVFSQTRSTGPEALEDELNFYQRGVDHGKVVPFNPEELFSKGEVPLAMNGGNCGSVTSRLDPEATESFWGNFYNKFGQLWSNLTEDEKEWWIAKERYLKSLKDNPLHPAKSLDREEVIFRIETDDLLRNKRYK